MDTINTNWRTTNIKAKNSKILPKINIDDIFNENSDIFKIYCPNFTTADVPKLNTRFLDMVVTCKNGKTKAIIEDGGGKMFVGTSHKNKTDKRDDRIGILIAVARAINLEETAIQRMIDGLFNDKSETLKNCTAEELLAEIKNRMFIRK